MPGDGVGFALLRVPKVGLEAVVFEGVTKPTLAKGPGHMPGTALPGQPGNAVISGHRTTYGRPFHDFDLLVPGDRVEVDTGIGTHVYEVRESFIVAPTDVWVTDSRPGAWLTFTTCNPKYSATERLIVTAGAGGGPQRRVRAAARNGPGAGLNAGSDLIEPLRRQDAVEDLGHRAIRVEEVGDRQAEIVVRLFEGLVAVGEGVLRIDLGCEGPRPPPTSPRRRRPPPRFRGAPRQRPRDPASPSGRGHTRRPRG